MRLILVCARSLYSTQQCSECSPLNCYLDQCVSRRSPFESPIHILSFMFAPPQDYDLRCSILYIGSHDALHDSNLSRQSVHVIAKELHIYLTSHHLIFHRALLGWTVSSMGQLVWLPVADVFMITDVRSILHIPTASAHRLDHTHTHPTPPPPLFLEARCSHPTPGTGMWSIREASLRTMLLITSISWLL